MAKRYHPDIFDNGLREISDNTGMFIAVTQGVPNALSEVTNALGTADGRRVSSQISLSAPDATLGDGDAGARRVAIASKSGTVAVSVTENMDLWLVIYDDTRILVVNDETSNQPLTEGNLITLPAFDCEIAQPAS